MRAYLDAPRPIAFAHRGGAKLWPENTLTSFEGALELGYRYIETDVHVTRDDRLVVFHDGTLDRTTNGAGPIAHCSLAELRGLDAGYWFERAGEHPFRGRGVGIPTLEEAFALHPDLRLNVEIKPMGERGARLMWEEIERLGVHDRILVAAAHSPTGRAFRRISGGRVATSAGFADVLAFWMSVRGRAARWLPIDYDSLQVPVSFGGLPVVEPAFVEAAHARGLHVHVWTVDDPAELERLARIGVDGLMTDRPDLWTPARR